MWGSQPKSAVEDGKGNFTTDQRNRDMSEHHATVDWERGSVEFKYRSYSRDHTWKFEGGVRVSASAAPAFFGNPNLVDPEKAYVASLASCHMLTFLAIAARKAAGRGSLPGCSGRIPGEERGWEVGRYSCGSPSQGLLWIPATISRRIGEDPPTCTQGVFHRQLRPHFSNVRDRLRDLTNLGST